MIVIKEGTPQGPRPPWWAGKQADCPKCRGRVQLEATDKVVDHAERHPGGKAWIELDCPTKGCDGIITLQRPARTPAEMEERPLGGEALPIAG